MILKSVISQTLTLLLLASVSVAQNYVACPNSEKLVQGADGKAWSICPGYNYFGGTTLRTVSSVDSSTACVQLCSSESRCVQATYRLSLRRCTLKSTQASWYADRNWDAIRRAPVATTSAATTTVTARSTTTSNVNTPTTSSLAPGTTIQKCPYSETNVTNSQGASLVICPGTDFKGTNIQTTQNVASAEACARICLDDTRCTRAVYDKTGRSCSVKTSVTEPWVVDNQFDGIRVTRQDRASTLGRWSNVIPLPVVPGSAYLVPQQPYANKVLVFSSDQKLSFGLVKGRTFFAEWNAETGAISERLVSETRHDMFCPGISSMGDGRIIITGGQNNEVTSIYSPADNQFRRGADMQRTRGYQSSTILSDGRVFTIGGSWVPTEMRGGKVGEVYNPKTNTWTLLPGADVAPLLTADRGGIFRSDNHAWLYAWTNGSVLQAGPSRAMNWYGTSGSGSVRGAGNRGISSDAMCGSNVMYDTGKILGAGGAPDYENTYAISTATITTITEAWQPVSVERVPDMKYRRAFSNAVVLPDGTTMVTGGQEYAYPFKDNDSILTPELFDPTNKTWKQLAPHAVPRNYHSVAILLADGRVFTGGGGLCGSKGGNQPEAECAAPDANHPNAEIYSPSYLFNADGSFATRPVIKSVSAESLSPGALLQVTMNDTNVYTFSFIRFGSATHSINTDQRRLSLSVASRNGATSDIRLPSDSGILLPGYWMLFALSQQGVPSVSRVIQVS